MGLLEMVTGSVLVIGIWGVLSYNRLIRNRNLVAEGWSGIDIQLKRRADLIPNLVKTVKEYMAHERGVVDAVVEKREACFGAGSPAARCVAEAAAGEPDVPDRGPHSLDVSNSHLRPTGPTSGTAIRGISSDQPANWNELKNRSAQAR